MQIFTRLDCLYRPHFAEEIVRAVQVATLLTISKLEGVISQ